MFDSNGGECNSPCDGYKLSIPEGAIPKDECLSVECGVVPYGPFGPFQYPDGVKPVSPIVWFYSDKEIEFLKPIEITLPHCIECKSDEECQSLVFLKANHNAFTVNQTGDKVFRFEKAEGKMSFAPNSFKGTLQTKHFCFYCLGVYTREDTDAAVFCLATAIPHHRGKMIDIHFCVCYFLDTCMKVNVWAVSLSIIFH